MNLRTATPADAGLLSQLGRDSFTAAFGHLYRAEDLASFLAASHSPEKVASELADPALRCRIAEKDGIAQGFCKVALAPAWPEQGSARYPVELKQLYCAPGTTGRGTGAALIEWALAQARESGADEMRLSVWSGNHRAQKFYARYGFAQIAEITFRVGTQIDREFLFACPLYDRTLNVFDS